MNKQKKKRLVLYVSTTLLISTFILMAIEQRSKEEEPKPTNPEILYGESDNFEIDLEETHGHNIEEQTIFTQTDSIAKDTSYLLKQPIPIKDALIPKYNSTLLTSADGKVYWYSEQKEIMYYDTSTGDILRLIEDVTNASVSDDGSVILFEKMDGENYQTFHYDLNETQFGFETIVKTEKPVKAFGESNNVIYINTEESKSETYLFPSPSIPKGEIGENFDSINNFDALSMNAHKGLLGYKESNNTLYKLDMGIGAKEVYSLPDIQQKEVVDLSGNPFVEGKYVITFTQTEDFPVGEALIYNNNLMEDIQDVKDLKWIDSNSIVYTASTFSDEMYLYNFDTDEKVLLANNVYSFTFDYESETLYFFTQQNPYLNKIQIGI